MLARDDANQPEANIRVDISIKTGILRASKPKIKSVLLRAILPWAMVSLRAKSSFS